jgi:hypothetical protein
MATTTYEPIATNTVSGSSTTTVTFASIPATYTDLVLIVNATASVSGTGMELRFNSDTANNYSSTRLYGTGSGSGTSDRQTNGSFINFAIGSFNTGQLVIANIFNYTNTTTFKTLTLRQNTAGDLLGALVGLWRKTPEAINAISIKIGTGNYVAGSTFTLYGIANADTGAKATGGVITYDDTYYYHTFGASGTFTPNQSLTADVLVVAGGGGGGGDGAGGGAGGVLAFASQSLTAISYTCTIGNGGAGGGGTGLNGTVGGDSQFGALTIVKGGGFGGGAASSGSNGGNGGSGGGGSRGPTRLLGGSLTSGQGNNGGNGLYTAPNFGAGGGGGAGSAGINGTSTTGGVGGAGVNTYTGWGSFTKVVAATGLGVLGYIAGGGGGGTYDGGTSGAGGSGGGGNAGAGNTNQSGSNAVVNTGGGGGGGSWKSTGGAGGSGGSGVIIIRYPKA